MTQTPPGLPVVEVHNVWTIYGVDRDGTEAAQPIAVPHRPQDWGHPRWSYHRYRFEWEHDGTRYINQFHGWTDLKRQPHDYPGLFASLIVMVLMPGSDPRLCGRDYVAEEDIWRDEWGEMPPVFVEEDHTWSEN
jgi:hypothetical protein